MIGDLQVFTTVHVLVSVLAIIAGLVVAGGLVAGARLDRWTGLFLATTIFTSVSGFGFPFNGIKPPHAFGMLSLILLAACVVARYPKRLQGRWRTVYSTTAIASLYLNVFVLVVQLFVKTPALAALAPTQKEAPFAVSQALLLALFLWLGRAAQRGFARARTDPSG